MILASLRLLRSCLRSKAERIEAKQVTIECIGADAPDVDDVACAHLRALSIVSRTIRLHAFRRPLLFGFRVKTCKFLDLDKSQCHVGDTVLRSSM